MAVPWSPLGLYELTNLKSMNSVAHPTGNFARWASLHYRFRVRTDDSAEPKTKFTTEDTHSTPFAELSRSGQAGLHGGTPQRRAGIFGVKQMTAYHRSRASG